MTNASHQLCARAAWFGLLLAGAVCAAFNFTPSRARATQDARPPQPGAPAALSVQLNADGTLKATRGSFDASGYRMELGANGAPRFLPAAAPTATCDGNWDAQFVVPGAAGLVKSVAVAANGDIYVGGAFTYVGAVAANYIAKWDGSAWSALGSGLNSEALAIAILGTDVYAGGSFSTAGGTTIRGLARWNGSAWSAVGTGLSNGGNTIVNALAVSGGNLYVGGVFTNAGGVAANNIAVWNGSAWSAFGTGTNAQVNALLVNGTDVYAGGAFTTAGGVAASAIARWNGSAWSGLGTGTPGTVYALALYNGEVIAGGSFTSIGGVSANRIARWNGSVWAALGTGVSGTNNEVRALLVSAAGLHVGGSFTTAGGVTVNNVARWNGSAWSSLGNGVLGSGWASNSTNEGFVYVYALAEQATGLVAGGDFRSASGVNVGNLASWNGSAWAVVAPGNAASSSASSNASSSTIVALAVNGNDVYVGGRFSVLGGVVTNNIVKWDGTAWSALGNGLGTGGVNEVGALALGGNGDLYAGGIFSLTVGGVTSRNIARWDGTSWSGLAGGLQIASGGVRSIVVSGGTVYAGGFFINACNNGSCSSPLPVNYVAQWNGSAWSPLGGGTNNWVRALALNGNELYAGGDFTMAGGVAAARVAKWNGSSWAALGTGITSSGYVGALALLGNELFVGGNFTTAGGTAAQSLAKWNFNTNTWAALGSGLSSPSPEVNGLAVSGNQLYVAGKFTIAGGLTGVNNLARWDALTGAWAALGSGVSYNNVGQNAFAKCLTAGGGNLYVSGYFTAGGDKPAYFFTRYSEGTAVINTQPANQAACLGQTATFTTAVTGNNGTLSYQWRKNGANIAGATGSSYTTPPVTLADHGALFELVAANACGATTVSAAATLTVNSPPAITAQPGAATVCAGGTATFSVTATNATTYQWRQNGANISGATAATLNIANAQAGDVGNYDVVVSGPCGTLTSSAAALTVNAAITTQPPAALTFCAPGRVYLQLTASGGPLSYQWRKNGVNLVNGAGGGRISDADTNQLAISDVQAGDSGVYDCLVSNGNCATLSTATALTIGTPPTFTPTSLSDGEAGQPYSQQFTAVGGTAPYTYTLKGGALPGGLTLTTSGLLSGTPTSSGPHSFRINLLDAGGCGAQQSYTLNINGTGACPIIGLPTPDIIRRNAAYSFDLAPGTTPPGSYSFAHVSGAMPSGISLAGAVLQGTTAAAVGNYPVTLSATSTANPNCSGSRLTNLKVRDPLTALALQPDYDGDSRADLPVWNAATGGWLIRDSRGDTVRSLTWGQPGDVPVLGDYDDDGKTDLAVFRPANGTWHIRRSSDGTALTLAWGLGTDVPVPGDYDGDGVTDVAVWRGSEGNWYIRESSKAAPGAARVEQWGAAAAPYLDVPLAGDYDGDGKSDLAVFRRATGTWYVKQSRTGQALARAWGLATDVPVPGDYDGDGRTDIAVWRGGAGHWYVLESRTNQFRVQAWGSSAAPYHDVPVPGDYDGDGRADDAVYRPAERAWYILESRAQAPRVQAHGDAGGQPVKR